MERWQASHSQHLSFRSSVPEHSRTLSLSLVTLPDSVSPFSSPRLLKPSRSETPISPPEKKSPLFVDLSLGSAAWPTRDCRNFLCLLCPSGVPVLVICTFFELSLIDNPLSSPPRAAATKVASRMFSKGDLKAWPIKWRQGQIFRALAAWSPQAYREMKRERQSFLRRLENSLVSTRLVHRPLFSSTIDKRPPRALCSPFSPTAGIIQPSYLMRHRMAGYRCGEGLNPSSTLCHGSRIMKLTLNHS